MAGKKLVLGGNESVKVAVVQHSPAFMNKDKCLDRAHTLVLEAGKAGAQLVLFTEAWLAGYPYWTEGWDSGLNDWARERVRFRDMAVIAPSEDTERLGHAARAANVYLVMGCNELDSRPEVNTIYNSLLFFGPDGRMIGRHRKTMPTFGERQFWGMGSVDDLRVFDTDIGRLGGLVCGEHVMTLVRAAMIAQGEEIHVAVFPGSFSLHVGPRLEEPDKDGFFWGHAQTRAHAFEAGAFVLSGCAYLDPADVPADFAYKGRMNIDYAHGGSQIVAPIGVPLVPPTFGPTILYADCPAAMIKAVKAIVDTMGHYSRPDIVELTVKRREPSALLFRGDSHPSDALERASDAHGVDPAVAAHMARQAIAAPAPVK